MNNKLPFFAEYDWVDPSITPSITRIEVLEFQVDIYISNIIATKKAKFLTQTKSFFGTEILSYRMDPKDQCLIISLPRIQVPGKSYSIAKLIAPLTEQKNKAWILGVNDFGPAQFDLDKLTHAIVMGASGFGKSSFFKFLLAQTLAFHDETINFIIDPKRVDYALYESHPRVYTVADTKEKWTNLLYLLALEIEVRKEFFSKSFKKTPSNLQEYNELIKEYKRNELPEFKRFLVWIDEFHLLMKGEYHQSESEKELVNYIGRVGRAFGIHLICSSQNYTDFSSDFRSQASTIFSFFMMNHASASFEREEVQTMAIPGRLNLIYGDETIRNIQTPVLSAEESIAFSYSMTKLQEKTKTSPFYKLQLKERDHFGKELIAGIINGNGLYVPEGGKYSTGIKAVSDSYFREHHHIIKANQAPPKTYSKEEADEILSDFNKLMNEKPKAQKETKKAEVLSMDQVDALLRAVNDTAVEEKKSVPVGPSIVSALSIKQTDNSLKLNLLLEKYKFTSDYDFSWCYIDLQKNVGLQICYKCLVSNGLADTDEAGYIIPVNELALNYQNKQSLLGYIKDLIPMIKDNQAAPLLIVKGQAGYGKKTILRSLSQKTGLKMRYARAEDFLQTEDSTKERRSDEFIILENLEQAVEFSKRPIKDKHPVMLFDSTPINTFFGKKEIDLNSIKYLGVYFHLVDLDNKNYFEKTILDQLVRSILKKYQFDFSQGEILSENFANVGATLIPERIDALIARAASRAKLLKVSFTNKIMQDILAMHEQIKSADHHPAIKMITPKKTRQDIILHEETMGDVERVIRFAENLNKPSLEFVQKLRPSPRMIALFHGAAGTGKSMAAEVLANELGKELWSINFADMQSMYVGETEKILDSLFQRAALSKQVLLFDECEVFLSSRQSGNSEYTHRIVNHLLNLFESFSGLLILTTNFIQTIDPAFIRRIDIKAEFRLPTQDQMGLILKRMLEPDAPLSESLDVGYIFKDIQLSGGLIRNAVEKLILSSEFVKTGKITNLMLRQAMKEELSGHHDFGELGKKIGLR